MGMRSKGPKVAKGPRGGSKLEREREKLILKFFKHQKWSPICFKQAPQDLRKFSTSGLIFGSI